MSKRAGPPVTRRFTEQRWFIDNTIRAVGMDWDQPRSIYLATPMGPEANADFAGIRQRITKLADASPAFEAVARRRQTKAEAAEKDGHPVTARDNYFMAAIHWGAAQWPIDENDEQNRVYNERKRECYAKYAALAEHRVEAAWIPLPDGRKLPAWFHLPPGYRGGRLPVVVSLPGMDSFKEMGVALYGDRWLSRGMAVLALDGPGQYESAVLEIFFSMDAWIRTGAAVVEWLSGRDEIDPARIGLAGNSFGSFFGTLAAAHEPRIAAVAVSAVCHEPGFHTIFEEASPTFKMRFMYMSGITDEAEFDEFRKGMTWEGHAEKIRAPYLCLAGEAEELSPLIHTERLIAALGGPKRLVVYQDSRHSVGNVPASNLGPFPSILAADWMASTLAGQPFPSEKWYVEASGKVVRTPL
ncbi:MAG: alpha/beta hydrolase [Candidatus Rokubacteria bacterium]|nr:alpha/beta hydrolase [Candidatus Rokubacteria bacterium]